MDKDETARLAKKFAPAVYRLAYVRTGTAADAEDVMQDVFLRLLTRAPEFQDDEHAKAWLLRVTANRVSDLHRSPWRRQAPLEDAEALAAPAPAEESGALSAVLALPPKLRVVVHLFYYEELSVAQIAQLLGLREGAVKTRLSRARDRLRSILTEGELNDV